MRSVTVRVPAKVNLQLAVGPRSGDGYHDLVNIFHAVSLYDRVTAFDEVTAEAADEVTVTVEGDFAGQVPVGEDNLAVQAARLVGTGRKTGPGAGGVRLRIGKAIPVAGGMAGGSADAAAALVAVDKLWGTGADLGELAGRVGSDVPFALVGGTAVGRGRGERLTPVESGGTFHWVFALSDGGLSTADVYREYDRLRPEPPPPEVNEDLLRALAKGDPASLGPLLTNDLQPAAMALRPELGRVLDAGRGCGALGAIVSGSGPTCAFLAESTDHALELAKVITRSGLCREVIRAPGPVPGATVI